MFIAERLPFLLGFAMAEPAVVCPALQQAGIGLKLKHINPNKERLNDHCRCAEVFVAECLPFLLSLAKAEPAVVCPALEQAGAIPELFASNLKLGPPASRQAASQLLILLYQQVHQLPCHKLLLSISPATSTWGCPHPVRLPHSS